jgi:cation diffusion facilitator family transporter
VTRAAIPRKLAGMSATDHHDDRGIRRALMAGIFANLGVAVAKFGAYLATRSAAMLAESVHSLADSSNQFLLLVGLIRSKKAATELHPLGYNVERYFWSFVVAVNIFVLGAVVAIYEGVHKMMDPHPPHDPIWNFLALGLALVFEAYALRVAWVEFQHFRRENPGSLWQNIRDAKDLALPTVLFEDAAALLGIILAAAGIGLAVVTHNGVWDGLASILIGVVLLGVAWFLATESHSLLIGEGATRRDRARIHAVVLDDPDVEGIVELITLQRGPRRLIVLMDVDFRDDLDTGHLEETVARLRATVQTAVPAARDVYLSARRRG